MKKQSLLFIAGGILALASCNTDTAGNAEETQAKVDSMVNARVEEIRMELEAKNDSMINEMAIYRADSIIAAMSGKKTTTTRPVSKVGKNTPPPVEAVEEKPKDGIKSKSDADKESGSESIKSKSDASKKSGSSKLKDKADK